MYPVGTDQSAFHDLPHLSRQTGNLIKKIQDPRILSHYLTHNCLLSLSAIISYVRFICLCKPLHHFKLCAPSQHLQRPAHWHQWVTLN
jgi:hypothetical protein